MSTSPLSPSLGSSSLHSGLHTREHSPRLETVVDASPNQHTPRMSSEVRSQLPDLPEDADHPGNKHDWYYFPDGNVTFLVEETLYKIHRYFFQRDSSTFASMFSESDIKHGQGSTDEDPIPLIGVTVKDFDRFLSILYPTDFRTRMATTAEEWGSILELAAKWNFESIKLLAIENVAQLGSPIDKIVLGRRHGIVEWLGEAYDSVCRRRGPLTRDEGIRLGMEDVIRISAVRQIYGLAIPRYDPMQLSDDLPKIFGFPKMGGDLHVVSNSERNEEAKNHVSRVPPEPVQPIEPIEKPQQPFSNSSVITGDFTASPDVRPESRFPVKSLTKMRKKRGKVEEQLKQAREQMKREQEERQREQAAPETQRRPERDEASKKRFGLFTE